ncbi:DNA adenine methylase [Thermovibrio sp.]
MEKELNIVGMIRLPWEPYGNKRDRNFLRKLVITIFLEEEPGEGGGNKASRYRYFVEETPNGKVFIVRPGHLKKGFDFVIHLENWKFDSGKSNPKHEDIAKEFKKKAQKFKKEKIVEAIELSFKGFEGEEVLEKLSIEETSSLSSKEISLLTLLKILKWMFIEQDIRDWNYSGRKMLKDYLIEEISNS